MKAVLAPTAAIHCWTVSAMNSGPLSDLTKAGQSRKMNTSVVHLLVERVTVGEDGIAVDLRHDGLGSVLRDMMVPRRREACA